jgi:ADP-ribosylglycohydrolase.
VNGGGQNQARAILTGALVGAQTGFSGIPWRFTDGLARGTDLLAFAERLAEQAAAG